MREEKLYGYARPPIFCWEARVDRNGAIADLRNHRQECFDLTVVQVA